MVLFFQLITWGPHLANTCKWSPLNLMGRMTIPYYWKIDERQCNWTRHIWFHLPGLQKMNEMKAMENLWFQCSIYRSLLEGNLYSKHFVVIHPSSMKFSWVAEVSKRQEPSFLGLPAVVIAMCWKCWKYAISRLTVSSLSSWSPSIRHALGSQSVCHARGIPNKRH